MFKTLFRKIYQLFIPATIDERCRVTRENVMLLIRKAIRDNSSEDAKSSLAFCRSLDMDINALFETDNTGAKTLLHYAVERKADNVVPLLIAYGADINAVDSRGLTVTHFAAGWYDSRILDLH
jgi:ankyrin repeat protein